MNFQMVIKILVALIFLTTPLLRELIFVNFIQASLSGFILCGRFLYWRNIVSGLSILSRIEVINLKDTGFS
jgi:hypothetical protein